MPFLKLCGRRWFLSSDDVAVPASYFLAVHFTCLLSVLFLAILLLIDDSVPEAAVGTIFADLDVSAICLTPIILVQLGILVVCCSFELALLIVSCRGSIVNFAPRESVNNLLIVRYGIGIFELVWLVLVIIWSRYCLEHCRNDIFRIIIIVNVLCEAGTCLSLFILMLLFYDGAGHHWMRMRQEALNALQEPILPENVQEGRMSRRNSEHYPAKNHPIHALKIAQQTYELSWLSSFNRCFHCFCTRKPKNANSVFSVIADTLCDQFGYLDLSSTDYVTALALLSQVQRKYYAEQEGKLFMSGIELKENVRSLGQDEQSLAELKYLRTVLRFAIAAGGYPSYTGDEACFSCSWACSRYNCATCEIIHPADDLTCPDTHICNDQIVRNDNSRCLNYASVLKVAQLQPHDIVYCNFRSAVFQTAFIVVISPNLRKVVISIRGTMSLEDVFTDLNVETTVLPLNNYSLEWKGHKGIVQAALYVQNHLVKGRLLERAFHVAQDHYADLGQFDLLLTGHSLGAGTAAVLGILLKEEYPSLQVVCFAPPGGLLSLPAAEYTDSFTRTVILGKDVIPRMGKRQLENLRLDMLNILEQFDKSKWPFISSVTCSCMCCSSAGPCERHLNSYIEGMDYVKLKEMRQQPCETRHILDVRPYSPVIEQLYLPGRISHIVREPSDNTGTIKMLVSGLSRFDYDDVLVSSHMISDHFTGEVLKCLDQFAENSMNDNHPDQV